MTRIKVLIWHIFTLLTLIDAELFTGLAGLERLLHTEKEVIESLKKYISAEEQRLAKIKWIFNRYNKLYQRANVDVDAFLSNPLNTYLLMKSLTADWENLQDAIKDTTNNGIIESITSKNKDLLFPGEEDLKGAASAILRLQQIYNLNTTELANGHIERNASSFPFTAGDCYQVGEEAVEAEDYSLALSWLHAALNRLPKKGHESINKDEIMEKIIYSNYMEGNISQALALMKKHSGATDYGISSKYFQDALHRLQSYMDGKNPYEDDPLSSKEEEYFYEAEMYRKLCNGERIRSPREKTALHCSYFTNNNPYLFLQPAKEEVLNLKPKIVMYHNVISDKEIDTLKQLAHSELETAFVGDVETKGQFFRSSVRVSKIAWLKNDVHPILMRLNKRLESITGLSTEFSESLQIANYGIGGFFQPHFDVYHNEENPNDYTGNGDRIATWLSYMSNVESGGATVFPRLGISLLPEKGSAAFWYNLLRNGKLDRGTLHAACPVLLGAKWASNKWFSEYGQEFIRRCSLDPRK